MKVVVAVSAMVVAWVGQRRSCGGGEIGKEKMVF
jgi:hypothetical protein